jgi:NAD(P)H-hydrate epimerase
VTAVPYGLNFLNLSGNHGMATAGSGDVLSGVIGAYLAAGIPASLAAPLGVYAHGLAGDFARAAKGAAALMAGDILDGLVTLSGKVDTEYGTE